ncbi:isochorismate synthase [Kitasatospora phosalacinea]|uniref:isochorismate synthase n=1 Tax=Kitasatospora phosalacinea TaxID=2065 RepID=A0A9W6PI72_9ACTN|nr:isochorismate synthase [Kitasatospora phosalacinea]GLW55581.1 isochorismate synthase DhbC [Kitasatospora phosalacinea]
MTTAPALRPPATSSGAATAVTGATGADLLAAYRPGPDRALLATPTRTLLAEGVHRSVEDPAEAGRLLAAARAGGRGEGGDGDGDERGEDGGQRLLVGAIPFAPGAPARLFVPERVRLAGPVAPTAPAPSATDLAGEGRWRSRPVPEPEGYRAAVAEAVRRLAGDSPLEKVVLARTLELTAPGGSDLAAMAARLVQRDPHGYTFAVPAGGAATLIGASPELLVSRRGSRVVSNPLAGSAARSADPVEDRLRAEALLQSPKDLAEHAFVVDAVRAALASFCTGLTAPERPTLLRTATMWHLSSTVTGTLREPATSALELALALHPTPAVCGTPTAQARAAIGELEPFDRGLYTGVVGWGDASGDGEWVVTLRCAEADGDLLRLFAGAGVVAASDPDLELAETAAKFRTFLHAVGLADAR